jgi:uncharacterized membrane protein YcaP (DUF421 family)
MPDYVVVLLNTLFSFIALFFIAKFLGKKQISELSFIDYVIGITIGSIAAEWSTDVQNPWYYYAIALAIYFIMSYIITHFERTTLTLKSFLRGKPLLIISNGKIDYKNLKKSKLDVNDLIGLCRDKGFFNMSNIAFAIFETSGSLSVLPVGEQKPTVINDFDIKGEKLSLQKFVINDGKIDDNYLKILNKDATWLYKKLNIKSKKDLKNILVAFYDEKTDQFNVHYKTNKN